MNGDEYVINKKFMSSDLKITYINYTMKHLLYWTIYINKTHIENKPIKRKHDA